MTVVGGEHLDPGPAALDPGRADEDRPQRLVADSLDREVGLEALQLAAEGVAPGTGVDQTKVVGVADDQAGAGAENRLAGRVVGAQGRLQFRRLDPLADRRALAAGNDQPVETVEVLLGANLAYLGAELAQDAAMGLEAALDR
jgi:hypothetical protein